MGQLRVVPIHLVLSVSTHKRLGHNSRDFLHQGEVRSRTSAFTRIWSARPSSADHLSAWRLPSLLTQRDTLRDSVWPCYGRGPSRLGKRSFDETPLFICLGRAVRQGPIAAIATGRVGRGLSV